MTCIIFERIQLYLSHTLLCIRVLALFALIFMWFLSVWLCLSNCAHDFISLFDFDRYCSIFFCVLFCCFTQQTLILLFRFAHLTSFGNKFKYWTIDFNIVVNRLEKKKRVENLSQLKFKIQESTNQEIGTDAFLISLNYKRGKQWTFDFAVTKCPFDRHIKLENFIFHVVKLSHLFWRLSIADNIITTTPTIVWHTVNLCVVVWHERKIIFSKLIARHAVPSSMRKMKKKNISDNKRKS